MDGGAGQHHRAIFISDVHLGSRASRAQDLLDFLRGHDADVIYLVGDIVDFWSLKRGTYWPQLHNDVVQKLLRKARKGTRIVLVPGNHDEALRAYCGASFGAIDILSETTHETADGRRLLITHGDNFDGVVQYGRWLGYLGDQSYELALWSNGLLNRCRRQLGLGYWSLSSHIKTRIKKAMRYIETFEETLAEDAQRRGYDGVVCGHIHHAAERRIGAMHYLNCGDWVESCTALVETRDGKFELIRWHDRQATPDVADHLPAQLAAAA